MDNVIFIPVSFGGKELEFRGIVQRFGYTYRISVEVFNSLVYFEPDEEGYYRALLGQAQPSVVQAAFESGLLEAIANILTIMSARN